jgi:hypothetical protein
MNADKNTYPVSDDVFREVCDSPASLPGRHTWVTSEAAARPVEDVLRTPPHSIGASPWVCGDRKTCTKCRREINWLDIVSSVLNQVHSRQMIARVILSNQKFVNTEVPRAIVNLHCVDCNTPLENLRSFKCHNWAYAKEALLKVLEEIERRQP